MPKLVKNILGEVFDNNIGNVVFLRPVSGEVQREDYINVFGFIAYLQNLTEACETARGTTPLHLGLTNQLNLEVVTLDFCYENTAVVVDDDNSMAYYISEYFVGA